MESGGLEGVRPYEGQMNYSSIGLHGSSSWVCFEYSIELNWLQGRAVVSR